MKMRLSIAPINKSANFMSLLMKLTGHLAEHSAVVNCLNVIVEEIQHNTVPKLTLSNTGITNSC